MRGDKMFIGYVRESTKGQKIGLGVQKEKIRTFASLKDIKDLKLIVDKGQSGKDFKRAGMIELIELCKSKEVSAVIIYRLDRLSRSSRDILYFIEEVVNKYGIKFYSVSESLDTTTPSGKCTITILGSIYQMERENIGLRTKEALGHLKERGYRLGSPDNTPFGLTISKRKKTKLQDLVVDPTKAKTLKTIFKLRSQNESLSRIGKKVGKAKQLSFSRNTFSTHQPTRNLRR